MRYSKWVEKSKSNTMTSVKDLENFPPTVGFSTVLYASWRPYSTWLIGILSSYWPLPIPFLRPLSWILGKLSNAGKENHLPWESPHSRAANRLWLRWSWNKWIYLFLGKRVLLSYHDKEYSCSNYVSRYWLMNICSVRTFRAFCETKVI